ncbi:MAG: hypothetical protein QF890_00355 [Myxococcota bacterium]|nr:hypothetical protein [Deltaproteobacteria bacterium]MCP4244187.1 hypothetical protein [bacterium]MDP6076190.1 hypothetical protein [Myxococcota bacterium]MDP6242281.1 hypothetical protein [Myxococcota bacterium]MDP7075721.1 hypothetical protein [Myxococcota bacterium]
MGRRAAVLLAVGTLLGCVTRPLLEQDWVVVETPHFAIMSSLGPEATRQLGDDLERFHSAVEFVTGTRLSHAPLLTRVYAFDAPVIERPFDRRGLRSYFLPSPSGPIIVLRNGGGWRGDATRLVRRRYAEYLLRNRDGLDQPLWHDSGFPEFASTIVVWDQGAEIGAHDRRRLEQLRDQMRIPSKRLLSAETLGSYDPDAFDREAWLVVHYLFFGQPASEAVGSHLRRYSAQRARGTAPTPALRAALGGTSSNLDRRLKNHLRDSRFDTLAMRIDHHWNEQPQRSLARDTLCAELGWLAIEIGKLELARGYFECAVAAEPRNGVGAAGLGAVDAREQRWEDAEAHFERALATAPDNARVRLEIAEAYRKRAQTSVDPDARHGLAEAARRQYRSSLELDEQIPETHAGLAATFLIAGEDPALAVAPLKRARELLPASLEIALLDAELLKKLGNPVSARRHANTVLSRTRSKQTARAARAILQQLDAAP